ADKRYSDYPTRQAFGDSTTPSGPSSHASRIASPGIEVAKHQNRGRVQRARNWHRVISSCTRILKAPLIFLAGRALSEPRRALRILSRAALTINMLQAAAWGAVMDVVVRLRCLGLGKYEAAFRELPSAPIKPRSSASSGTAPGLSDNFSTSSQSGGA